MESTQPMTTPPVTQEQLRIFADAARDPNPIHQDEATAKANGLPGVIAHGMWVASHLAEYAQRVRREEFGPDYRLARFQVRFKGMTLLGERLRLRGSHRETEPGKMLLQLEALGEQGEIKATASASIWKK